MKKFVESILFIVLVGCVQNEKPSKFDCNCLVIEVLKEGKISSNLLVKRNDAGCSLINKFSYGKLDSSTLRIISPDSVITSFGRIDHVLNSDSLIVNTLNSSVKLISEPNEKFIAGNALLIVTQMGSAYDTVTIWEEPKYLNFLNSFISGANFEKNDSLLVEFLEARLLFDSLSNRRIPNLFIKAREMQGVVRWKLGSLVSFQESASSLFQLHDYELTSEIKLQDSISKDLDQSRVSIYRKNSAGIYQLIGSECPEVFEDCMP